MSWEELLDITPGMFLALNKQRREHEKGQFMAFRFLGTIIARCAGNKDANFMEEQEESSLATPDMFIPWLEARAIHGQIEHQHSGAEGTPAENEQPGGSVGT